MPFDLTQMTGLRSWQDVHIPGAEDVLRVAYYPHRYTLEVAKRMEAAQKVKDENFLVTLNDVLVSVIADWDMTNGGEPYPCTPESIVALPEYLKGVLFGAFHVSMLPPVMKPSSSADGFEAEATSASSPNGTSSAH